MRGKPVRYSYQTGLKWTGEKKGLLQSIGKSDIEVACPPEFSGHENIWSPEDLFLASIEVCTMTTFLWLIKKENISLKSYESNAEGIAELKKNIFRFQSININMKITVSSEEDRVFVKKIIDRIPKICLVSKSIIPDVKLNSKIFLE